MRFVKIIYLIVPCFSISIAYGVMVITIRCYLPYHVSFSESKKWGKK